MTRQYSTERIEQWCLSVAARVVAKKPAEDDQVEVKATWPDPSKAARRLCGHANAISPEQGLWVIGLDEKAGTAPGVAQSEFSNWWNVVESRFEGEAPRCHVRAVKFNEVTLFAILLETADAPFVLRVQDAGAVEREVPWREGTRVRSAKRQDLLRLMSTRLRKPRVICDRAHLHLRGHQGGVFGELDVRLHVVFYDEWIRTFLARDVRCEVNLGGGNQLVNGEFSFWWIDQSQGRIINRAAREELVLRETGVVKMSFKINLVPFVGLVGTYGDVVLRMLEVDAISPITLSIRLKKTHDLQHEFGFDMVDESMGSGG